MTITTDRPEPGETAGGSDLLELDDLHVTVNTEGRTVDVVRGVSLRVPAGQTVAVVGESGSGKSMTALSVLGLLPRNGRVSAGEIRFAGADLSTYSARQWRELRGDDIAMIFQDPMSALNPCFTIGSQIAEMFRRHRGEPKPVARERSVELMTSVGIPDASSRYDSYPHEFSGGMRQRVMIAIALALEPSVLLADEPTTALDVTVQAQILRLLRERQSEADLAMVLVSHDLGVVARMAHVVSVMYAGRIVEHGPLPQVYSRPAHPYTLGLMGALPESTRGRRLQAIPGQAPDPANLPSGCPFHPRCPFATDICRTEVPRPREVVPQQVVECHHAEHVREHGDPATMPTSGAPHGTDD